MTALYDELVSGPLAASISPLITSGDAQAIFDLLSAKNITAPGKLSTHDIRQYFMLYDLLLPIEAGTSGACKVATRALEVFPEFDLAISPILTKFTSLLDALIADSKISSTDKDTLLALADKQISRLEQLGLKVFTTDIAKEIWNDDGTRRI